MSLEIIVYCKEVSQNLIPEMLDKLNDYDMVAEVHPEFKFDQENDSGFLPFKFTFLNTHFNILKDKHLLSGFELYIDDFDLQITKESIKSKPSLLNRLLGQKHEVRSSPPEQEIKLKDCKKAIRFIWHSADTFQLRFALLISAILTELTNGVCTYTADDIWCDNQDITNRTFKEVIEYESSLKESEIKFFEFQKW